MKNHLSAFALLSGMAIAFPHAMAQPAAAPAAKETVKKPAQKAAKKAPGKVSDTSGEEAPDIAGFSGTPFNCELGARLTVYESTDRNLIKLRWNKEVHEMTRVETSTGANRFESSGTGLVWIHIPAKGMLLDSRKGQQLANECRTPQQMKAKSKTS